MASATLNASPRTETGKGVARKLRAAGQVPAVIYGHGREPQALTINARELDRMLTHVSASTVIELAIDGGTSRTLIRELQRHPFRRQVLHVDFQELVAGEKVAVRVTLVYQGVPDGVRLDAGVLDQILHEVEIEADPSNIPESIVVDVTHLTIGHALHVSDLKLPEGVIALDDPSTAVCLVAAPTVSEEPVVEATGAEPELIRKAKPDDEK